LSLVEAAHQLGATPEEVRAWAEEGILPHRIVGGAYVFELALLVRWQLRGEILARQGVGGLPTILA
jgi:DNA-binding transcriptional MerR regulator